MLIEWYCFYHESDQPEVLPGWQGINTGDHRRSARSTESPVQESGWSCPLPRGASGVSTYSFSESHGCSSRTYPTPQTLSSVGRGNVLKHCTHFLSINRPTKWPVFPPQIQISYFKCVLELNTSHANHVHVQPRTALELHKWILDLSTVVTNLYLSDTFPISSEHP